MSLLDKMKETAQKGVDKTKEAVSPVRRSSKSARSRRRSVS